MIYRAEFRERNKQVLVVGCGGTGGFVAEGLCRLLPPDWEITLQDHDRVEERNLCRQNFFAGDLGKFKAEALAERLADNYRRAIAYKVIPFTGSYNSYGDRLPPLLIGCVDNATARKAIARAIGYTTWWIDSGNGHHSGQVLVGTVEGDQIKGAFMEAIGRTKGLPKPSAQLPGILLPAPDEPKLDCALAVQRQEQSPLINQLMATIVLQAVQELISGTLSWMSAFIDQERGISYTPIEPALVARLCGVRVDTLFDRKKLNDNMHYVPDFR